MRRLVLPLLLCLAVLALCPRAEAQTHAAAAPTTGLDAAAARQALAVLRDPHRRAALEATLEAILRAAPATPVPAPKPEAKPAPKPAAVIKPPVHLNPNGLGAAVLLGASRFLATVSSRVTHTLEAARSLPLLWSWLTVMATDPLARALAQEAAWRVVVVMALGFGAEFALRRLLPRIPPVRATIPPEAHPGPVGESAALAPEPPSPAPDTIAEADAEAGETEPPDRRERIRDRLSRFGQALRRLGRDLLPILAFALVGHIAAATGLGGSDAPRLIVLALVDGYALWRVVVALVRFLVSPDAPRLRVLGMSDATASWTLLWLTRIAGVASFGYAIEQVALLLGMSPTAADALLKLAGLVNHVFFAVMIFEKRRPVRAWLRAPEGSHGPVARMRNALAPIWHWLLLGLLTAEWLVWAIELRHGYAAMLRGLVIVIAVAVGTRILQGELHGLLTRLLRPGPAVTQRYPGLEARLALYHPIVTGLARAAVLLAGLVLVLELLGVAVIGWATGSALGQRMVSGIGTIGFTLLVALVVWEGANAAMQAHLARLTQEAHVARAARMRTLLPLLRSALTVTVGIVAGLTVLSQIGIDVAPLLAGAGIVGVAIGFGSQKLVQDLITGIFLLLENAMQVGDWVTVSGLSGSVENLSVRTIRLRAGDGSVHIIPFSSVTSVTNTNRGLGNAAVSVTLAYSADSDRAGAELKAIASDMRKEATFAPMMLSELQLWGVDKLDGAAVTLAGQIPCTDTGRWPVQREFNRRVKLRFQELGIALYNPSQTLLLPAPPAEAPHDPS
ncbi:MAG: mechanosensitive ion channel domain-containing protein [Acetobacteraceae bacterium]